MAIKKIKITAMDKVNFVKAIAGQGEFESSDIAVSAILNQLITEAKREIATKYINKLDKDSRKEGKMIANKRKEIIGVMGAISFKDGDIFDAFCAELGVEL